MELNYLNIIEDEGNMDFLKMEEDLKKYINVVKNNITMDIIFENFKYETEKVQDGLLHTFGDYHKLEKWKQEQYSGIYNLLNIINLIKNGLMKDTEVNNAIDFLLGNFNSCNVVYKPFIQNTKVENV
jgi:hypothetical protein